MKKSIFTWRRVIISTWSRQRVNDETENIGARRLHTLLENLLEEVSFTAPERPGDVLRVDAAMVRERLALKVENHDLSRYIL